MSGIRRIGAAAVFAVTVAGGVFTATPASAGTLANAFCPALAAKVTYLQGLASQYPNSRAIAFLLGLAQDTYARYCR